MVKAHELRTKDVKELESQLTEFRKELAQLRVAKVSGGAHSKLMKINVVRKNIARILTVITTEQKKRALDSLKKNGAKYLPKDLRPKKTRAIRRQLTHAQKNKKTLRQQKKSAHFPLRKFAIKQ